MRQQLSYLGFSLVLGVTVSAAAQIQVENNRQRLDVDERMLQEEYHIAPTKEGFLIALRNAYSGVRSYGALRLAADKQTDAVPAILAALAAETVPGARESLALAAAQLGADEGALALRRMCADVSGSGVLRMGAASAMLTLGREDCLPDVLDVLRLDGDFTDVIQAISLLPRFHHLTAPEVREVQNVLPLLLKHDHTAVRMSVSQTLRFIGGVFAVQTLRSALPLERDEIVRRVMANDLKALEAKEQIQ